MRLVFSKCVWRRRIKYKTAIRNDRKLMLNYDCFGGNLTKAKDAKCKDIWYHITMSIEHSKSSQAKEPEKIEQKELIFQSDPDPLLEGYFDEVRQRTFRPRTDADVEKAASLELSGEPLTQLTEQELERLGIYLRKNLQVRKIHVNTIYRALIED